MDYELAKSFKQEVFQKTGILNIKPIFRNQSAAVDGPKLPWREQRLEREDAQKREAVLPKSGLERDS